MKKKAIISIIGFFWIGTVIPIQAQKIGIKGSLGLNQFNRSTDLVGSSRKNRIGFSAGLTGAIPIGSQFSLHGELLYSQKGQKNVIVIPGQPTICTNLDYIELPVLVQMTSPASEAVRPLIFAGGYAAFLLSAKEVGPDDQSTDIKDRYKKTDFGIVFGAGLQINFSKKIHLILDGRYSSGLQNINSQDAGLQIKNRSLVFSVGILL